MKTVKKPVIKATKVPPSKPWPIIETQILSENKAEINVTRTTPKRDKVILFRSNSYLPSFKCPNIHIKKTRTTIEEKMICLKNKKCTTEDGIKITGIRKNKQSKRKEPAFEKNCFLSSSESASVDTSEEPPLLKIKNNFLIFIE
jgi:hypothetical protein